MERFRALRDAYQAALDASVEARLVLDEITVAAKAPSMTLALVRAAAPDQSPRRPQPDDGNLIIPLPDHSLPGTAAHPQGVPDLWSRPSGIGGCPTR